VRRVFVTLFFCFCSLSIQGQKTRFGQELPHAKPGDNYPIKVHISGLHYRGEYVGSGQTADVIYADAVMNGKKVELRGEQGIPSQHYKLPLGDYQARLLKDSQKVNDPPLFQVYELVLPDKTVWRCNVTGISE
jgi:hypothetical protein